VVLFLSVSEVFYYLPSNKVKSTLGVNVYYFTFWWFWICRRFRNKK